MVFTAGSMFWIRSRALMPILNLAISNEDFEVESGQTDGTLAHAIERFFTVAAKMGGYRVVDTRLIQNREFSAQFLRSDLELAAFDNSKQNYPFAPSTYSA
jgi:lipopolysaccharide biosynthesis protein